MTEHCCELMIKEIEKKCDVHADCFECPDNLIHYSSRFDAYGLIIHDGGQSTISIFYCPWCGKKLPVSRRDEWFNILEARGIDPWEDEIPPEFEDDTWWRNSN